MAKQLARSLAPTPAGENTPSLNELKALRRAQRDTTQRVEALKLRLFQISERHMDQTVRLIKRWVREQ